MQTPTLENSLTVPDAWQQKALKHLKEGSDVVVHAPTGAGKTFIFELLVRLGRVGSSVFTVPTRALANDKLYEWRDAGWNVGIMTGDLAENTSAPVVVATLETQRHRFLRGDGPDLLVVDEYQMLADPTRGVNYELVIALAPAHTQLLLLSGSVGNPEKAVAWLQRIGRRAVLVDHQERPVPLEEVFFDALPDRLPKKVHGFWVRRLARALAADLGPILVFAPRRRASEELARQLAGALPLNDPLELSPEQKRLAGGPLARMLRNRVCYHHSGLSYQQRAGLIEPLAKAGQLRVVVATTGLAAGINFSMRSVVVTDREYRVRDEHRLLRADELLQMFGRAGRRGLDERGAVLVAEGKPRLSEASPLQLRRTNQVDWPVFLLVLRQAWADGQDPVAATDRLVQRLFSDQRIPIGLKEFLADYREAPPLYAPARSADPDAARREVVEMCNSAGQWERRKGLRKTTLGQALRFHKDAWRPALTVAKTLSTIRLGSLCRIYLGRRRFYGREVPLAQFPSDPESDHILLLKWVRQGLRQYFREQHPGEPPPRILEAWTMEAFERDLLPLLPHLTQGGKYLELVERRGTICAQLDYSDAEIFALFDQHGQALLDPPLRTVEHAPLEELMAAAAHNPFQKNGRAALSPAEIWYRLQLIDNLGRPTRRGILFSFFHHGEGLALAAALEDDSYPVEDLLWDVANIRAGHRFDPQGNASGKLRMLCRQAYRGATYEGYLNHGVPEEYGEGASEILREIAGDPGMADRLTDEELRPGDIERARLEWRSLLNHIAHAPDYDWDRWLAFRAAVRAFLSAHPTSSTLLDLPPLTLAQRTRRSLAVVF